MKDETNWRRDTIDKGIYHVFFLPGTVGNQFRVSDFMGLYSCVLFHPVTGPQKSHSFDVQVVNKKSESTVLYSKGMYPSGLCVSAAELVLFICLS